MLVLKPVIALSAAAPAVTAAPATLPPPPPGVEVVHAYGMEFSRIGNPGNRPANAAEAPGYYPPFSTPPFIAGAVGHEYAIARTEVTASQWLEFANAYAPHYSGWAYDENFTSEWLTPASGPGQPLSYRLVNPAWGQRAVTVNWYYAARFVNWLSSGRATTAAAFESGVYDASTFAINDDGTYPAPAARAPGASVFMASFDEWVKAAYYDPDRYGPGQGGYWRQPTGSDAALVGGYPEDGGQTLAGQPYPPIGQPWRVLDIVAYPDVQTPSGLFDMSGSVGEWTDSYAGHLNIMLTKGSGIYGDYGAADHDRLDALGATGAHIGRGGIRLAITIPTPASALPLCAGVSLFRRRRRENYEDARRHLV